MKPKPKPVLTKQNFVRRYAAGEFGNNCGVWNNISDWLLDLDRPQWDLWHIRNRLPNRWSKYNVPTDKLVWEWFKACSHGHDCYVSPMGPPDKERLLQGEVSFGPWGYRLLYSTVPAPMRDALAKKSMEVTGVAALWILKRYLCLNSFEWLEYLLHTYEDHVVEFTVYRKPWGSLPGYNTIFWEVRKY
jgi:hypothetical protein